MDIALAIRMDNNFLKRISQAVRGDEAWSTLLVYTAKNLTSFGSYDLIKTPGLLIGCGKKWEILRHFQGKLCGKKGLLCGKLCDFLKADLTLFF